jgi:hypothetical protein
MNGSAESIIAKVRCQKKKIIAKVAGMSIRISAGEGVAGNEVWQIAGSASGCN